MFCCVRKAVNTTKWRINLDIEDKGKKEDKDLPAFVRVKLYFMDGRLNCAAINTRAQQYHFLLR